MAVATAEKLLSFEQYLHYDDASDNRYELIDGELALVSPPTVLHLLIAKFLERLFDQEIQRLGLPWRSFREAGVRTGVRKARYMDVCIVTEGQARELMHRTAVFEQAPILAVEIVSEDSVKRDYRYKRSEYATAGIPEYWIIDPLTHRVSILLLEAGLYEAREYTGKQAVVSNLFNALHVTASDLLLDSP